MKLALVAIQLAIRPEVLASLDAYRQAIDAAVARALDGVTADARLVVLPEAVGHLALYAKAGPAARRAKTVRAALAASAVRRPLEVLRGVATTRLLDPRHAVLAALAPDAERWWKSVCGPLARRHEAHLVGGSYLRLGVAGELTNASPLYAPDGRLVATAEKTNLVPGVEDGARGGLALARGGDPVAHDTPFGKLATLVGYDAFVRPEHQHERFVVAAERLAARIVAHPAANPLAWSDDRWRDDGLPAALGRIRSARFGVTAHLVGGVLDLRFSGTSQILERTGENVHIRASATSRDDEAFVVQVVNVD